MEINLKLLLFEDIQQIVEVVEKHNCDENILFAEDQAQKEQLMVHYEGE